LAKEHIKFGIFMSGIFSTWVACCSSNIVVAAAAAAAAAVVVSFISTR